MNKYLIYSAKSATKNTLNNRVRYWPREGGSSIDIFSVSEPPSSLQTSDSHGRGASVHGLQLTEIHWKESSHLADDRHLLCARQ